MKLFQKTVHGYCKRHGLKLTEAAHKLRIPYRTLQDWWLGLHEPRGFARELILGKLKR